MNTRILTLCRGIRDTVDSKSPTLQRYDRHIETLISSQDHLATMLESVKRRGETTKGTSLPITVRIAAAGSSLSNASKKKVRYVSPSATAKLAKLIGLSKSRKSRLQSRRNKARTAPAVTDVVPPPASATTVTSVVPPPTAATTVTSAPAPPADATTVTSAVAPAAARSLFSQLILDVHTALGKGRTVKSVDAHNAAMKHILREAGCSNSHELNVTDHFRFKIRPTSDGTPGRTIHGLEDQRNLWLDHMRDGIDSFDKYLAVFISKFYFEWDPMHEQQQLNTTISNIRKLNNKLTDSLVVWQNDIQEVKADKEELEGMYRRESQKRTEEMNDLKDANALLSKQSKLYENLYETSKREASEQRKNMEMEIEMLKKRNGERETMIESMQSQWKDAEQNIRNVLECTSNMIKCDD